jgi:hypothetical protein
MRIILTLYPLTLIGSTNGAPNINETSVDDVQKIKHNVQQQTEVAVAQYLEEVKKVEETAMKADQKSEVEAFSNKIKNKEFFNEVEAFHKAVAALKRKLVDSDKPENKNLLSQSTEQIEAFVNEFIVQGALLMAHSKYSFEKIQDADKHAKAVVEMLIDDNCLEQARAIPLIAEAVNFDGGQNKIYELDVNHLFYIANYNLINRQTHGKMAALNEVLDKAKEALAAGKNGNQEEKKRLKDAVTKAETDITNVTTLLSGDDGFSKNYKKVIEAYNKTLPQTSITQNVKSGLGTTEKNNTVLIVCLSIAALLIVGAAIYLLVLKKH